MPETFDFVTHPVDLIGLHSQIGKRRQQASDYRFHIMATVADAAPKAPRYPAARPISNYTSG